MFSGTKKWQEMEKVRKRALALAMRVLMGCSLAESQVPCLSVVVVLQL